MADIDMRWAKTDASRSLPAQLDSIPAPALVIDANGLEFFKYSTDPCYEQYYLTDEEFTPFPLPEKFTVPPYDFLGRV